jgi:ELWxxDGT repeat protein
MQRTILTTPANHPATSTRRAPALLSVLLLLASMLFLSLSSNQPTANAADSPFSILKDINPGSGNAFPGGINVNGTLFFAADDGTHGHELWKSDGTAAGTVLVKDINPGLAPSIPYSFLTRGDGILYFLADDGTHGAELWRSDGTAAGTTLVKAVIPDDLPLGPQFPRDLIEVNGTIFYTFTTREQGDMFPTYPQVLWKSDGTAAGTVLVKEFPDFVSPPENFINVNGTLFFTYGELTWNAEAGKNLYTNGAQLWKSDGTETGTVLVKSIDGGGVERSIPFIENLTNVNDTLFFSAMDGNVGTELWKSDGTEAGTVVVKDIRPGTDEDNNPLGAYPYALTDVNGTLFFAAWSPDPNFHVLWKSDGTEAGTVKVKDIYVDMLNAQRPILAIDGLLYFRGWTEEDGMELWKSDGTAAGTMMVKDIQAGSSDSKLDYFTDVNGTLYFLNNESENGIYTELWQSDGTAANTVQLAKEIELADSMAFQDKLLLTMKTAEQGMELWFFDPALVDNVSTGPNFPDGAPGSVFIITVPDLPAGADAAISLRGPGADSFTSLGTVTVPETGTLLFLLTTADDDPVGTYTIRIVVETAATSLAETITRELSLELDSAAPQRTDRPDGDVPTIDASPTDEPAGNTFVYLPFVQR